MRANITATLLLVLLAGVGGALPVALAVTVAVVGAPLAFVALTCGLPARPPPRLRGHAAVGVTPVP